ncbi:hypothetical protein EOI86_23640 [Hwanghaeella grinnelliae]|uniref:Membrane protein 6-pyruvoyl-tetrahydropterin synthase-related domain-containing protein n=1 Tax=Hwanghaeella grinnelliae TaxID=2500179 RepID=A0A3S2Z572_9PROT|nr:hypothetical protein [Hwanghaeella grinnelliae]RVU34110.1 hypothetical protein EOI86_23640 [Hwanghaeella grinnelliae]
MEDTRPSLHVPWSHAIRRARSAALCVAIITTFVVIALIPQIYYGYPNGHSAQYNVPWAHAFSDQLSLDTLYPRWLYAFPDKLGGPIFYFYAPLPFYLNSLLSVLSFSEDADTGLLLTHSVILVLSAATFYIWIGAWVERRLAVLGAIAYMLLPYHFVDLQLRNAIGECMAYVWLPLIFWGIQNNQGKGRCTLAALLGYTALVYSHLPSALLAVLPMVAYTASFFRASILKAMLRLAFIGIGGVLLASPYVIPAILLRKHLHKDAWSEGEHFLPETWLLPDGLFFTPFATMVTVFILLPCALALALHFGLRFPRPSAEARRPFLTSERVSISALWALLPCLIFLTELTTWIWENMEFFRKVQFPWRLGSCIDFLTATIGVLALNRARFVTRLVAADRILVGFFAVLAVYAAGMSWFVVQKTKPELMDWREAEFTSCCVQAPEYVLPSVRNSASMRQHLDANDGNFHRAYLAYTEQLANLPERLTNRPLDAVEDLTVTPEWPDRLSVSARLTAPVTLVLKQSYFPLWEFTSSADDTRLATYPDRATGLLSVDLPKGSGEYTLKMRTSKAERIGSAVGGLAAIILALGILFLRFRRPDLARRDA